MVDYNHLPEYDGVPQDEEELYACINELKLTAEYVVKRLKEQIEDLNKRLDVVSRYASRVNEMEAEHAKCIKELEKEKEDYKRSRIDELTQQLRISYYKPRVEYKPQPKCDRCDNHRMVEHISPVSGKVIHEPCPTCGTSKERYKPSEVFLHSFNFGRDDCGELMIYQMKYYPVNEEYGFDGYCDRIIKASDEIPDIDLVYTTFNTRIMFESREMCEEFCKRLTEHFNKDGEKNS